MGYLGSFLGVGTGLLVTSWNPEAKPLIFQITAVLFLIFALPCFFFVREPRRLDAKPLGLETVRGAVHELSYTLRRVGQYPGLGTAVDPGSTIVLAVWKPDPFLNDATCSLTEFPDEAAFDEYIAQTLAANP